MKKSYWLLLAIVSILVFCLIYFFLPGNLQTTGPFPPGPNVRISSKPFQPIISEKPRAGKQPLDMRTPPLELTSNPTVAASSPETLPPENAQNTLRVRVQDALGEPVKKGVIALNGKEHTLYGGLFLCEDIPKESCGMVASAKGYSSATGMFDPSKTGEYSFTLEYTSSHGVTVYADKAKKTLCPGADVYLWKGMTPPRPPITNTPVLVEGISWLSPYDTDIISRTNVGLRVASIQKSIPYAKNHYYQGLSLRPSVQDVITGVDLCNWGAYRWEANRDIVNQKRFKYTPIPDPTSPNLRIWDVLSMAEKSGQGDRLHERIMIRFLHDEKECYSHIRMPLIPVDKTLIQQGKTDQNGQCKFSGLPPGIYYIQAGRANQRSAIITFLPTQGHTQLAIFDSSRVSVSVKISGLEQTGSLFGQSVPNAKVSLMPSGNPDIQGKGLYSGSTDKVGMVILKPVQWGTYRMSVEIPEEYSAPPIIQEVTIYSAYHDFTILIDSGVSVSGKVVRKDHNTGVPDYSVELRRTYSNDNYIHGVAKTDSEGNFVFIKVQPGTYILKSYLDYDENTKFLPYPTHFIIGAIGAIPNIESLEIEVNDTDVEGLEYPVSPVTLTHWSGQVVDEDNIPVPGARLSIEYRLGKNPLSVKTLGPQPPTTDENGRFSLMIPSGAEAVRKEYTYYLVADMVQVIPYTPSEDSGHSIIKDTIVPLAQGEIPVTFHIGDERMNLKVTLNTSLFTKRINGIIKTEDNGPLDGISISARQDQFQLPVSLSNDGTFLINGLKPGKITISTMSRGIDVQIEGLDSKILPEYHNECILVDIPSDDNPDLYVEITLKKAGYLTGVVLDSDGIPKKGVWIITQLPWDKGLISESPTEIDGQFILSGIPLNYRYDLTVLEDKSNAILTVVNGVQPSVDGLVIQCP